MVIWLNTLMVSCRCKNAIGTLLRRNTVMENSGDETGKQRGTKTRPLQPDGPGIRSVQFVYLDGEGGTSTVSSRKAARSYAAKESHARARRDRLARYQNSKRQTAHTDLLTGIQFADHRCIVESAQGSQLLPQTPNPRSFLSATPADPFATAARPISNFEYLLLNHCESVIELHLSEHLFLRLNNRRC
jgi:hypothetical protein